MLTERLFMENTTPLQRLRAAFSERLLTDVPLEVYTAARVGGPADYLLEAGSADELADTVSVLWQMDFPFVILGGGSNVLISDLGVRGVVVLNRAKESRIDDSATQPHIWSESGANFGSLARRAAQRGLGGMEWAAGIPGTLGGALVGNAGAHGGDVSQNLVVAEIIHKSLGEEGGRIVREDWTVEKFAYSYRSSALKRPSSGVPSPLFAPWAVVLSASMRLHHSTRRTVQARIDGYTAYRRQTQPPGASMGSMFKNPPGDYAGRLIEAAGLKGARVSGVEISTLHANFFINHGDAAASDVFSLIKLAHDTVADRFDVRLELEIELIGEFPELDSR